MSKNIHVHKVHKIELSDTIVSGTNQSEDFISNLESYLEELGETNESVSGLHCTYENCDSESYEVSKSELEGVLGLENVSDDDRETIKSMLDNSEPDEDYVFIEIF